MDICDVICSQDGNKIAFFLLFIRGTVLYLAYLFAGGINAILESLLNIVLKFHSS